MSRTVHHVPYTRRDSTRAFEEADRPLRFFGVKLNTWEWHSLTSLRYSARIVAEAQRGGHRPRPQHRRHRLEAYEYPRTYGKGHAVSGPANRMERALRAADRVADRQARQVLRGSQDAAEAAWDVEFRDPRHRHFGVWDSW